MPINPSIALSGQAPQTPDLMQSYGQMMTLKNLMQQGQINQQVLDQNQMKMDALRQQVKGQQIARDILSQNPDIRTALPALLQALGPNALEIAAPIIELETKLGTLKGDDAKRAKDQLTTIMGHIENIARLPEQSQTSALQNTLGILVSSGVITPEMAQSVPPIWDTELYGGLYNEYKLMSERLERDIREEEEKRKGAEERRKAELHPLEVQEKEAKIEELRRGPKPVAGRDVPYPPEVEAQMRRINAARMTPDNLLTPEGIDMAARQFALSGVMPALGMGASNLRAQVINRAAELYPTVNPAENKAAYDANKSALTQLQRSYDAIVSFERTAQKNLDVLLESAKGITDLGSPLLNKPVRLIEERLLGNEQLPAFRAARRIDVNEIAKIVSNPNMTGILTNEARQEIDSLVPDSVTIKQLLSVAAIMRRDMNNRKVSLEEQIAAIKHRIGTTLPSKENVEAAVEDLSKLSTEELLRRIKP